MRQFQERQKIKAKMYSKTTIIILIIVSLFLAKAVFNIYMKSRESAEAEKIAKTKLIELQSRQESLQNDIANLESTEGQEGEFRKKFNVAYPGEKMIVVVDEEVKSKEENERGVLGALLFKIKGWFN